MCKRNSKKQRRKMKRVITPDTASTVHSTSNLTNGQYIVVYHLNAVSNINPIWFLLTA